MQKIMVNFEFCRGYIKGKYKKFEAEYFGTYTQLKKSLSKYAKEHHFTNTKFYVDDGYTGTNFNRPGFKQMLEDIEAGYVTTVIVKDMSRLGRNYLQVGYYTDVYFI